MRLGQIRFDGAIVAAVFEKGLARPIPAHTMLDLIQRAEAESIPLTVLANQLATRHPQEAKPVMPICPAEVWGCGCTYETSATFRDGEQGTRDGMYAAVYRGERPEIFFKGTGRVCVGPGQKIGIRSDSVFTAPEPEICLVLGSKGTILGFTLGNDVSAWDIERENPLYLPQSKSFNGCVSLGPVILTADEIRDIYGMNMTCVVERDGVSRFEGSTTTARLNRKFESLVEFLLRSNAVPSGSILMTGTGIIVTEDAALAPGDTVSIRVDEFGELVNTAAYM